MDQGRVMVRVMNGQAVWIRSALKRCVEGTTCHVCRECVYA